MHHREIFLRIFLVYCRYWNQFDFLIFDSLLNSSQYNFNCQIIYKVSIYVFLFTWVYNSRPKHTKLQTKYVTVTRVVLVQHWNWLYKVSTYRCNWLGWLFETTRMFCIHFNKRKLNWIKIKEISYSYKFESKGKRA